MSFNPPREIARFIGDATLVPDTVGESPCSVRHFLRRGERFFVKHARGGVADRWLDVAFVHRELRESVSMGAAEAFLDGLGQVDQSGKRLFFEQLDELF